MNKISGNEFNEEPFKIENELGQSIFGITHIPESWNGGLVVMFNIGLHYRVSHSRLFVRQARRLQSEGFTVARLDTARIGYSHGEMPAGRAIDTYDAVQTGLFKDDARLAVNYLMKRFNPKKTLLTGLCGGALTAILTAALEKDIDGVVFIAGPVTVTSPEFELSTMHPVDADILFSGYLKRVFSVKAWGNFLSGKSSYGDLFNSIKVKIKDKLSKHRSSVDVSDSENEPASVNKGDLFNRVFLQAFDSMMNDGKKVQFIMPELDRATYDFDRMFAKPLAEKYGESGDRYEIARVAKADHTFSRPESSEKLFSLTSGWLLARMND